MDLLTLSRYILESSLLHSQFSIESDSLVASAALWLASCMSKKAEERAEQTALWTTALQHYTGLFFYMLQQIFIHGR
jgi:Cyclin, C-terminal domain